MSRVVITSIPFSTRLSKHGGRDIVHRDRARAKFLLSGVQAHGPAAFHEARKRRGHGHHGHLRDLAAGVTSDNTGDAGNTGSSGGDWSSAPAAGQSIDVTDAGVTYTMSVGVGSPPTQYDLLIDTGSSNTFIGAQKKYVPTSTSKSTGNTVKVSYGSGSFSGTEYTDTVTLGSNLVIENQSIGVASTAQDFNDVDGILGIGPVDLTEGTVSNTTTVPTVTDNLFAQGTIKENSIGISYVPTTSATSAANGELTFGGTDSNNYTGDINYVPITSKTPASKYWGVDQDLTYGDSTPLLQGSAGIVDTGTTLLLIATDAFKKYQQATGGVLDSTTGLLSITEAQYEQLQSMFFKIGDVTYEFTANAQIWPRALNATLGGDASKIYLVAADMGSLSGGGLDFINGFAFLQRFYSVYDTQGSRLGLATTQYTNATTN